MSVLNIAIFRNTKFHCAWQQAKREELQMININDRVHCAAALSKITTAEKAAEIIQDGMNLGMSGFTPSGYPKALPLALAERGKKEPFKVNVWTVLAGPEIDTEMVNAGIVGNRMPYQTDKTCRNAINNGQIK